MARAGIQRTLAAAGLSVVTGTAAIGLAVVGVGPLGQVAASVRDAGAAVSRGVLSVVMPDEDTPTVAADPGGDRPAAAEGAPARMDREDAPETPAAVEVPEKPAPSAAPLPDAGAAADEPDPLSLVDALSEGLAPSAQAAGDAGPGTGVVDDVLQGVLGGVLGD